MEWYYVLRLFIATLLGLAIGFERKMRFKEAGIRTHSIVAMGSCLLMLISMYAFGEGSDKARVAAQIVAGVGFLGTGMIMFKGKSSVSGLTTAAGIWLTAGVGMAIGGGMYILGVGATVMVILIQCILHLPLRVFRSKRYMQLKINFTSDGDENETIKALFDVKRFSKIKASKVDGKVVFSTVLTTDKVYTDTQISNYMKEYDFIQSIERVEDE